MKGKTKIIALALCLCLCLCMVACGGSDSGSVPAAGGSPNSTGINTEASTGTGTGTAAGSEAAAKKTLNIATIGESDCLYPIQMTPPAYMLSRICYDTLVTYENGQFVPKLAESWEISEDGCVFTLHLRKNVRFHDGEAFDAEAVKANFVDLMNGPQAYYLPTVGNIKNIECPEEHTVVFYYDNPFYGLLADLCWADGMPMVSPKQIAAKNAGQEVTPVGTGPYAYEEYVKGEYTRFVKNEDYWDGAPYYDEIIAKYIPDEASRIQALKNGEVDLLYGATELSYDDYFQLQSVTGMTAKMSPIQARNRNLTLNLNGVLGDPAVREAIALSIDKELISEGVSHGYEAVADTILTPGALYEDACPKINYSYDPEKAAELLDAAGWIDTDGDGIREKDGTKLSFVCTIQAGYVENRTMALVVQDMLSDLGMQVEIKELETNELFQSYYDPNAFDMTFQQTYYDYAMPTQWFSSIEYMAQGVSLSLMKDSETFIGMTKEFTTTNDDARLREIFHYLVSQLQDQFIDIPLTGMMEPIVFNSAKIADYNYGGCYQFFNPLWITPAE